MPLDLSAYDIELGDTRDLVEKLNNAHRAIEAGVNATEDTVTDRLDDQDAIIDGLAGAMTAGVTFKGTHSAAGGSYPVGPAAGDYWIISAAGTISGVYFNVGDSIVYYSSSWIRIPATPDMSAINPLTKAIRVAITAAASGSNGIQALDNANLDMATNGFTPWVRKRISNTRPSATEVLMTKYDSATGTGVAVELMTTGHLRIYINRFPYKSTDVLPSATNVMPFIQVPVTRETATGAGSVVFVVDGVQLGSAVEIAVPAEKVTNSTFDTDISGWTINPDHGGAISWASGKLRIERIGASTSASQAISMAAGETRVFSASATHITGPSVIAKLSLRTTSSIGSGSLLADSNIVLATSGNLYVTYTSPSAQTVYLHATTYNAAGQYDFDNITSIPSTYSVNNSANLFALGTSTTRTEGDYYEHGLYNRAVTVAQCLRHYLIGPDPADVGSGSVIPSQTITSSWTWSNFAGAPGYETFTTSGSDITSAINTSGLGIASAAYTSLLGKRYRVKMSLTVNSGTVELKWAATTDLSSGGQQIAVYTSANDGDIEIEFVAQGAYTRLGFYSPGSSNFSVTGFQIQVIGIVGWWNAEDAQSNTGQIFDRSGNKGHCVLPAAGASIIPRPPRTFQVRSTHSWAETHELQYLTLVNQPVVPATAKLVRIFGEVTSTGGSGPQDFIIGDGSDGDRYVVLTSGLTTGKKEFTIDTTYAGFNDGTNLKLTIDPDANCTMTVALVLVFENLE